MKRLRLQYVTCPVFGIFVIDKQPSISSQRDHSFQTNTNTVNINRKRVRGMMIFFSHSTLNDDNHLEHTMLNAASGNSGNSRFLQT